MDKKSNLEKELEQELLELKRRGQLTDAYYNQVLSSVDCFRSAFDHEKRPFDKMVPLLSIFFKFIIEQLQSPHKFEAYHRKIRTPVDYYQFSLDFFQLLINLEQSTITGIDQLANISEQLSRGENVVFLANHQTEADPQAIAILLKKNHPKLAEQIIYVAGERVITDPVAIPFSLGTDLLCIYSKRYIDSPPEEKAAKQIHNKHTMELMSKLLQEGGKAIYVAPAGGRDRKDPTGQINPTPFDPNSIEMFYLMAKKAKTPTHFYPLALDTYQFLPPPSTINIALGEVRTAKYSPVHLSFGAECEMEESNSESKHERRKARADKIWESVCKLYREICR
jgi:glycerol-3-phosphate O-acyltransferase